MDTFNTHGAFSWSELTTTDTQDAARFYTALFNWGTREMEMPSGTYTTFQVGESSVGGMLKTPPGAPPVPSWGCYVTVTDIDATCKQATGLGGKVMVEPFDIPTIGRMAILQDPQGAMISVITYVAPAG